MGKKQEKRRPRKKSSAEKPEITASVHDLVRDLGSYLIDDINTELPRDREGLLRALEDGCENIHKLLI